MTDHELNVAVADACGIDVAEIYHRGEFVWCAFEGGGDFRPATNWHDAMLAAEMCGLFSEHGFAMTNDGGSWHLYSRRHEIQVVEEIGPRAICEAILAVTKGDATT